MVPKDWRNKNKASHRKCLAFSMYWMVYSVREVQSASKRRVWEGAKSDARCFSCEGNGVRHAQGVEQRMSSGGKMDFIGYFKNVRLVFFLVFLILSILSFFSILNPVINNPYVQKIDDGGRKYLNESLKRASITFFIARSVNAGISFVQDFDVNASPLGAGGTFSPGEFLDPVNDIIERFSWIMLLSTTSLGIQKVLLEMGIWIGFKILLSIALLLFALSYILNDNFQLKFYAKRILILAILARFFIPFMAFASGNVYSLFLEDKYYSSYKSLKETGDQIDEQKIELDETEAKDKGFFGNAKDKVKSTIESMKIGEKLLKLKDITLSVFDDIIDLIMIFALQTILLPLFFLWIFIKLGAYLFKRDISSSLEQKLESIMKRTSINRPKQATS